jgi:outer membrane protein assembly factor BamE (lipoprotein component of BamABCDE complex)
MNMTRAIALLLPLVLLNGCLFGGNSKVRRSGTYVAESTLAQIEPGKTTAAWVRGVVGKPSETIPVGPTHEIWKYAYSETKDSSGYVFLIFSGSDQKVTQGNVFIEINNGIVTKTWRG